MDPLSRFWVELRRERTDNLPVIAALNRPFHHVLLEQARRAPWFAASLLFHVLLYLILKDMAGLGGEKAVPNSDILATLSEIERAAVDSLTVEVSALEIAEPVLDASVELHDPGGESHDGLLEGSDGSGRGGAVAFGAESRSPIFTATRSTGVPGLDARLHELRSRGLEVALVFDATSSMWQFIDSLKQSLSEIVVRLSTLVPNHRLAVVAYRDKGDEFVTKEHPLSAGRYSVLGFIEDVTAAGGGDIEEAVAQALRAAVFELRWAPDAQRVIVLAGDAAPHKNELREAISVARGFRSRGGIVHTIAVSRPEDGRRSSPDEARAIAAFKSIASAGGGSFEFLDTHGRLVEQMIATALGQEWREEIERLELGKKSGFREASIRKHEADRDLGFFVARLRDRDIHHGVIDAILRMGDRRLLPELAGVALDEALPTENRLAAVYALKRLSRGPVAYDPRAPRDERLRQSDLLRRQFGVPLSIANTGPK